MCERKDDCCLMVGAGGWEDITWCLPQPVCLSVGRTPHKRPHRLQTQKTMRKRKKARKSSWCWFRKAPLHDESDHFAVCCLLVGPLSFQRPKRWTPFQSRAVDRFFGQAQVLDLESWSTLSPSDPGGARSPARRPITAAWRRRETLSSGESTPKWAWPEN